MGTEQQNAEYGADQIQILEGLEAVRKRPGMYIGSTSVRGLHHLVYEIVDNAVDEALAGFCTEIQVIINKGNSITVIDNGRGIPVGINHKSGLPAVEVVFTILHAGGKFGGGGYKVSGGLHGVGASVVNALSTWLEVRICHEGKIYQQRYERGKVMYPLKVVGTCPADQHGTEVHFLPDPEIFEETEVEYRILSCRDSRCLVFFFRRSELEYHLMLPDNQRLLEAYGYHMRNLDEMLKRLAQRVRQISSRKLGFPHEIGVFLGYPKEDVEGFIHNEGRKYLMIGYWKVYSNPSRAKMIFKSYDQAKEGVVREFLAGKSIREIAQ